MSARKAIRLHGPYHGRKTTFGLEGSVTSKGSIR
jgi:hypothetical protein